MELFRLFLFTYLFEVTNLFIVSTSRNINYRNSFTKNMMKKTLSISCEKEVKYHGRQLIFGVKLQHEEGQKIYGFFSKVVDELELTHDILYDSSPNEKVRSKKDHTQRHEVSDFLRERRF